MGTRLVIALAALGALIGLVAVKLLVEEPGSIQAAEQDAEVAAELGPDGSAASDVAIASGASSRSDEAGFTEVRGDSGRVAVALDENPEGLGVLIVETLLNGEPHDQVKVAIRGDADPLRARADTEPWAFYLPAKSSVVLDITDEVSGWTQIETTLAPVAGDVRTLTVDLDPPQIDGEVLLQVRSESAGTPVLGARVVAISESPPDLSILETDGGGNAKAPRGPGISYVINADGFQAVSIPPLTTSDRSFQIVELRSFARLFGRVQSQGGATTQVQLMRGDPNSATDRHSVASATIAASGAWSIEGIVVPKGQEAMTGMWIELNSKATMRTLATGLVIEPNADLEVIDPWISGLPVSLEFLYPSGTPVKAGTKVFLRREAETEIGAGESVGGVVDDRGRIEFPALYVGRWSCEIGPARIPELLVTGDPTQRVEIEGFDCIAGTLRWAAEAERSLAKAIITVTDGSAGKLAVSQAEEDGTFRIDFVPVHSIPLVRAYTGDSFRFTDGDGSFFSSGEAVEVAPGALDVSLTLVPDQRKDRITVKRRSVPQPALNFDK